MFSVLSRSTTRHCWQKIVYCIVGRDNSKPAESATTIAAQRTNHHLSVALNASLLLPCCNHRRKLL